jgi:hypothetical protein
MVNPYREAIVAAGAGCVDAVEALDGVVAPAQWAFEGGAWRGGLADQAYERLAYVAAALWRLTDGVVREFEDAARAQPAMVPVGAWQVHWRNF